MSAGGQPVRCPSADEIACPRGGRSSGAAPGSPRLVELATAAYPAHENGTGDLMARGERLNPPGVHMPQANYSHVTRVGDTLYVSGQLPLDESGALIGSSDPQAQAVQCYRNIKAIVEHFGGTLEDVVKITQFTTDIAHRPALGRARDIFFTAPGPSSTLVAITALANPDAVVEIEAIAVLG